MDARSARLARHVDAARQALAGAKPDLAVQAARRALQLRPNDPDLLSLLAVALFEAGQAAHALEAVQRAVLADPGRARAHYNKAVLLARTGAHEAALAVLEQVLRLEPGHPAARVEMSQVLATLGRPLQAMQVLDQHLARHPDDLAAARDRAVFAERSGQWQAAADAWAAVAAADPADDRAQVRLVAVQAERDGPDAGRALADRLTSRRPDLAHDLDKALAHAGRGMLRLGRAQPREGRGTSRPG